METGRTVLGMQACNAGQETGSGYQSNRRKSATRESLFKRAPVADYLTTLDDVGESPDRPLAIYLHIPYSPLASRGDPGVLPAGDDASVAEYLRLLELELRAVTRQIGVGRRCQQIHLGGTAPNALSEKHILQLGDLLDQYLTIDQDTDASINADSRLVSFTNLDLLNGIGFNQIVFSVHDLHPDVQSAMGKVQSANRVGDVYQACREAGFEFITSDIGYGLPNQTRGSIEESLAQYLTVQPDRIMCRAFNPGGLQTDSGSSVDTSSLPSLAEKMVIFSTIVESLESSGYQWIGVDCFAKSGDPICEALDRRELGRNRIGYGVRAPEDVVGIGRHAVSDVGGYVAYNHSTPMRYAESLRDGGVPVRDAMRCSRNARQWRSVFKDLACNRTTELSGKQAALLDQGQVPHSKMASYLETGLIRRSENQLRIDPDDCFAMNSLWNELLPDSAIQ